MSQIQLTPRQSELDQIAAAFSGDHSQELAQAKVLIARLIDKGASIAEYEITIMKAEDFLRQAKGPAAMASVAEESADAEWHPVFPAQAAVHGEKHHQCENNPECRDYLDHCED